jgi:hypothetical protein
MELIIQNQMVKPYSIINEIKKEIWMSIFSVIVCLSLSFMGMDKSALLQNANFNQSALCFAGKC